MKILNALIPIVLLVASFHSAHASLSIKQCGVLSDYLDHTISAEKACEQGGGLYCANSKNDGEKICKGLGGPGGFCSTVQNLAQGYCMIIGESYCDKVEASATAKYEAKAKDQCKMLIKNMAAENAALKAKSN